MSAVERARRLLPALWLGHLLCVALIATPAPFATLPIPDAGRVVGRIFLQSAWLDVALALLIAALGWRRDRRSAFLALGALLCTVIGYFGLQPLMQAARAGSGPLGSLGFAPLHGISMAFFALKGLLVAALAWRAAGAGVSAPTS